jgi:hypothetical protein
VIVPSACTRFLGFIREVLVDQGGLGFGLGRVDGGLGFRVQVGRFGQRVPELGEVPGEDCGQGREGGKAVQKSSPVGKGKMRRRRSPPQRRRPR